jgi:glutathione S-transferase
MSFEEEKMAELQIIGAPQSNYVCVTRIACFEKSVRYTLVPARPHSPEVDAIHPFGKIPVMRHGDVTLSESRAICYYIDHAFDGPPLVPRDPVLGARAEEWISLVNTHIDPILVRQYLRAHFFPNTPDGSPDRAVIDAAVPQIEQHFALLDRAVARTGYLVGDSFTLADINLLPILFYMNKMPESGSMLRRTPNLQAYYQRHWARPSAQEATPPPFPGRQA